MSRWLLTSGDLPERGDYGVTRGTGALMWLVRLGTFSRYGHAAVCTWAGEHADTLAPEPGMVMIIEAVPTGARTRWVHPREFVWSREPLTTTQRMTISQEAHRFLGRPYDWRAIVRFILRFWGRHARGLTGERADDQVICSELVVHAYRSAGLDLMPGTPAGDISPGDLADRITRAPYANNSIPREGTT